MRGAYIGTSGFQYKSWGGDFYPDDVPQRRWLEYYASQFNSVEINSSFYRLPSAQTFRRWREAVPDGFRYAIKGSRYVTHQLRLRSPEEAVAALFERASELGAKLGVVLWQLPESLSPEPALLERFCEALRGNEVARDVKQAFELRHRDWFQEDTYRLLHRYDFALVTSQSAVWPEVEAKTASWSYWRFHGPEALYGSGYSQEQLERWAARARATSGDLYAYFNNDAGNFAFRNAGQLRDQLAA